MAEEEEAAWDTLNRNTYIYTCIYTRRYCWSFPMTTDKRRDIIISPAADMLTLSAAGEQIGS